MKKVIFCASALIFGGMLYAQTPTQATQAEKIPALPFAAPGANSGQSTQNGNENKVMVFQAGTSQSASTYQDDGTGTGNNQIMISQTGMVGPTSGVENNAEARQSGSTNKMIVDQQGDENSSLTTQGQSDLSSTGNAAWIRQGTGQQAQENAAETNQDGDNNVAKVLQTYDNSTALINQTGDDNMAFSEQDAGPNLTDGHASEIAQDGNNNQAYSYQEGAGARNESMAVQTGDDNKAYQTQENTALAGGAVNSAFIEQGPNIATDGNFIVFPQLTALDANLTLGGFNVGASFGGIAYQDQIGSGNDAEIFQFGSSAADSNYAEQNQDGENNRSYGVQNAYGAPNGGNYLRQDQAGDNNLAGAAQMGGGHKAYQTQNGDENIALSTQLGEGNLVNIHQSGDMNVGHTSQNGINNGALLNQIGGHSYTIQQNLSDPANGGNQANILQTGPTGLPTDGVNCTFEDPRGEMGSYDTPDLTIQDVCPGC